MRREEIEKVILAEAGRKTAPSGEEYRSLSLEQTRALAARFNLHRRVVEESALEAGVIPERYQRSMGTVGLAGQLKLLRSAVGIAGAGGLGGLAVELLARMGVGRLVVVDGDCFSDSNLNRQLLAREEDLGRSKAEVAAERVRTVNDAVQVEPVSRYGDASLFRSVFQSCRVVLDCLDNLSSRFALEQVCAALAIPLVHGAVAGWLGQLAVIDPGSSFFSSIYGNPGDTGDRGAEMFSGNPAATPALVASWQVNEAVKIITGAEKVLSGQLLIVDLQAGKINPITV